MIGRIDVEIGIGKEAERALGSMQPYVERKITRLLERFVATSDKEEVLKIHGKISAYNDIIREVETDIQTGELAAKEKEDERY